MVNATILDVRHLEHYDLITTLEPMPQFVAGPIEETGIPSAADYESTEADRAAIDEFNTLFGEADGTHLKITRAYTKDGLYVGTEEDAEYLFDKLGLRDLEPLPYHTRDEALAKKIAVQIGFQPNEQKWYGWSHRAIFGFGIGYIAQEGHTTTTSGWLPEYLEEYPEKDLSVPVGFECKTLEDCKRCAIAHAESVS